MTVALTCTTFFSVTIALDTTHREEILRRGPYSTLPPYTFYAALV